MAYNYPGKSRSGDERRRDPLRGNQLPKAHESGEVIDSLLTESVLMSGFAREVALANIRSTMTPEAQVRSVIARTSDQGITLDGIVATLGLQKRTVNLIVMGFIADGEAVTRLEGDGTTHYLLMFDDRKKGTRKGPTGKQAPRPGPNAGKRLGPYGKQTRP